MFGFSDEIIFYGGISVMAVAFISLIIWFCISKVRSIQIKSRLDREYGPSDK